MNKQELKEKLQKYREQYGYQIDLSDEEVIHLIGLLEQEQFNEICEIVHQWQLETFKSADTLSKLHHLKEEVDEAIEHPERDSEFADCFMLIVGAWMCKGKSPDELLQAVQDKHEINKNREWGEPDENGVVKHITP